MPRARHAVAAAALVWLVTLLGAPGAAAAVPSVTYKCTPAPTDCTGWYRSNVSLEWTVLPDDATKTGCANQTFTTDTSADQRVLPRGRRLGCSRTSRSGSRSTRRHPRSRAARPGRAADINGWYNHAVGVEFLGNDLTSGVASCTATTYGGPDNASASVQGTCFDRAGNESAPRSYGPIKYDETAPIVTAARTDRPPDHGTWFTAPVRLAVEATDATSGLAECPTVTYGGPGFRVGLGDRNLS